MTYANSETLDQLAHLHRLIGPSLSAYIFNRDFRTEYNLYIQRLDDSRLHYVNYIYKLTRIISNTSANSNYGLRQTKYRTINLFCLMFFRVQAPYFIKEKKVREKSRECHNHKPQPFPDPKRKRKPTNLNKHKPNKRTKSTKISSLFPKRGNRNTKRTEKHKNKMIHGKTYNRSPRRINHKATKSKTNTGTTALERSVEQTNHRRV